MTERLVFNYGTAARVLGPAPPAPPSNDGDEPSSPRARDRERGRDWGFIGLMAFTAILFFRPQDQLPFLRPLHLAEVAALVGLCAMVVDRLARNQPFTRVTPELLGVVALGAVILATVPFSVWPGGAVATFTDLYVKVILIFVLMVNTLTTPRRIERFTWLLVVATSYIAFRAVFDYARGINLIENGRVQGAVGGIFRNPNDLALNMVAVLPLGVLNALYGRTGLRRLIAAGGCALMIGTVIVSHSRSGSIGLAAMALLLGLYLMRRRPGLIVAGVLAVALALPFAPASYWQRLSSITDGSQDDTGSREARRVLLREGFEAFLAHPFTGVGAGQFKNYAPESRVQPWRETHNVLLQVGAELGAAGLAVFVFLLARAAGLKRATRRLLRRARDRRAIDTSDAQQLELHAAALAAALGGWFVCALFASVAYHWTFYYLLALAAAPRELLADRVPSRARRAAAAATRLHEVRA